MSAYSIESEDHVKQIRYLKAVRDNIQSSKITTIITSGSFSDGLEMRGNDLDIMFVMHKEIGFFEDLPTRFNIFMLNLLMAIDDEKPCFTFLKQAQIRIPTDCYNCEVHNNKLYFSSAMLNKPLCLVKVVQFMVHV